MRALQVPPDPSTAFVDADRRIGRTLLRAIPLAAVAVALVVGVGAYTIHTFRAATGSADLDAMTRDVRSVTPTGSHETSVKRYGCGGLGDSEPRTVTRVLAVDAGNSSASVLNEIGRHFHGRNWADTPGTVPGGLSVEHGDRFLVVTRDPSHVYLQLQAVGLLC